MAGNAGNNIGDKVRGAFESVYDIGESIRVGALDFIDSATGTSGRHENTPHYSKHHQSHGREVEYDRSSVSPRAPHQNPSPAAKPNLPPRAVEESGPFTTTDTAPTTAADDHARSDHAARRSPVPSETDQSFYSPTSTINDPASYAADVQSGSGKDTLGKGKGSMSVSAAEARRKAQAQLDAKQASTSKRPVQVNYGFDSQPVGSAFGYWDGETSTLRPDAPPEKK